MMTANNSAAVECSSSPPHVSMIPLRGASPCTVSMCFGNYGVSEELNHSINERYRIAIISGSANPQLAKDVAHVLGIAPAPVVLGHFADGEIKVQLKESIRGADIYIVQPTCPPNVDSNIQELILLIHCCKLSSARRVTAVVPYYGYARQDRKHAPRVPISASCVARQILSAEPDRLLFIDLHCGQLQGFFGNTPTDHLSADSVFFNNFAELFREDKDNVVIVSPDAGGVHRAKMLADMLYINSMATILKRRAEANKIESMQLVGDVKGKLAIIYDDIIDTAGTLVAAANLLKQNGAKAVYAAAAHGIFSANALEKITESPLERVFVTDTIRQDNNVKRCPKLTVLSVATMIASAVAVIHAEQSISMLNTGSM
eukprot:TRINITY_DN6492_c0_g1_i1.p1 TRINITY_DN6492_c0_g1~~TRINITY_DN6492_c0_g1_i1.p1  ORF type:complete len:373 (-),score=118.94 TRINITY_DN6492_c0_g1_i1:183-1301(-)